MIVVCWCCIGMVSYRECSLSLAVTKIESKVAPDRKNPEYQDPSRRDSADASLRLQISVILQTEASVVSAALVAWKIIRKKEGRQYGMVWKSSCSIHLLRSGISHSETCKEARVLEPRDCKIRAIYWSLSHSVLPFPRLRRAASK